MRKKLDKTQQSLFSDELPEQSRKKKSSLERTLSKKQTGFCVQLPLSVISSLRYLIFSKKLSFLSKESINGMAVATVLVQPTFVKEEYLGFLCYSEDSSDLPGLVYDFLTEGSYIDHHVSHPYPFIYNIAILQSDVRDSVRYLLNTYYHRNEKEIEEVL